MKQALLECLSKIMLYTFLRFSEDILVIDFLSVIVNVWW